MPKPVILLWLLGALCLALGGCGSVESTAAQTPTATLPLLFTAAPTQAGTGGQTQTAIIMPKAAPDKTVVVRLEAARTEQQRETGLMNRPTLAPDAGMIFIFDSYGTNDAFYMKDTLIPLSIAFIDDKGVIVDIQDMAARDEKTLHVSKAPYKSALEVNLGFFGQHAIVVGDIVRLML